MKTCKCNLSPMMLSDLNLTQDVAGATFMAVATSSPELFVNIIGTFVTESDLGFGTVVGSAVFNTLGVAACIGLAAPKVKSLHQYELSYQNNGRDINLSNSNLYTSCPIKCITFDF